MDVLQARRGRRPPAALAALVAATLALAGCAAGSGAPPEPTPTPRTGPAETRTAVAYATGSPRQTLDLYLPAGDGRTVFPLAVLVHGGGFFEGSSDAMSALARRLAEHGVAAASVNYRLSGEAPFPAAVQDVAAAVRYLRANARGWGVDPHRFAAWGESAGGYLAAMVGVAGAGRAFDDPALGTPGVSSAVQAVVDWYGPADFSTMDDQAREAGCDEVAQQHGAPDSPESRWLGGTLSDVPEAVERSSVVRQVGTARSLPSFLLVHGTRDCTVPPGQSQQLHAALDARGARVTLHLVDGAGHSDPQILDGGFDQALAFVRSVWDRR